jgi:hypothetical protein
MGTHGVRVRNVSAGFMLKKVHVREAVARPGFVTPPATHATPFSVTLSVATAGAEIRYTIAGGSPSPSLASWSVYSGPIPVESNTTILVQAFKDGLVESEVVTGRFFVSTLDILPLSLPAALMGQMYTQMVTATGGMPPYAWDMHSGALPPGLGLSSNGMISGVPLQQGTGEFELIVHDAEGAWKTRGGSLVVIPEAAAAALASAIAAVVRARVPGLRL